MEHLLVLDNYDSFTYNLVHLLKDLGCQDIEVHRNDQVEIEELQQFQAIVLSPGPGLPEEAGIMPELVRRFAPTKRILGICLGHQCIAEAFGGRLRRLATVVHGKDPLTKVIDPEDPLFEGLPPEFRTGRYHSWVVDRENFPACLRVTAVDAGGDVMALRHSTYDVCGLQFHPESVLTPVGRDILRNWLRGERR
jgi:anthranilate synthase component 2